MTVRWGVLGAGWIVERAMLGALTTASGASVAAIAARDPARARRVADAFGVPVVHETYDDLLADPSIDAVYVALANDAHAPRAIAALEAGKHVLCEKPLALSVAEVDAMTAAAASAGRLLVEASWYRWHPRMRLAERLLHEVGALGTVRYVSAGFTFAGVAAGNYRLDPAMGGGALYDVGCYVVSAALAAFGAPAREVTAKACVGPTGVDLTAELAVTFDTGDADLRCSVEEEPRQWLMIEGDRGAFDLRPEPFTAWEGADTDLWFAPAGGEPAPEHVPAANAYRLMVEQTSAAIEGRDAWVLPLAASRATAAVLDAAFESAAAGTPVAL
ncbi:MAG TPA: Gfo/Idh/MocA family oxidoreductase [Mycobacteriales bacterium]|jgi:predicted dehydrogenase|nr:Gfo/Idh/MocA family oxidoreductase [Mycobacteriales bacterium]